MGQRLVEAPLVVVYHHAMWCQRCCFFVPVKGLTCALFKVYMADASPAAVGRHVSHRRDRGPLKRQHVDQQQHPPSIARSDCIVADADPDRETWMPIYSPIWFAAATTMVAMRYWLRARGHAGKLGLDDVRHQREKRVGGIMADDLKGDFVPCLGGGIDVYDSDGHVYGTSTR
jgi:hypothetical protein